ncbi:MAG TPA: peptidylprolyl isomerase [Cyclobacteriaceae bacterium]|nr:peptidylprolyl isomerase [Cyclobacteriaceae bacterium]
MKKSIAFFAFFIAIVIAGCAGGSSDDANAAKQEDVVTIHTSFGDMVLILYDETPKHKENFLKLVNEKYYDSTLFHRVISGFMIQGGDPDSKSAQPGQPLGRGGPEYTIPAEFNPKFFHEKGALAAARMSDQVNPNKESSGSQFYIVQGTVIPADQMDQFKINSGKMRQAFQQMFESGQYKPLFDSLEIIYRSGDLAAYNAKVTSLIPRVEKATGIKVSNDVSEEKIKVYGTVGGAPSLDNEYTVFGRVIKGLEVIDKIAAVEKDPGDRPVADVKISMTSEKMTRKKIEKEYGYKFPAEPSK